MNNWRIEVINNTEKHTYNIDEDTVSSNNFIYCSLWDAIDCAKKYGNQESGEQINIYEEDELLYTLYYNDDMGVYNFDSAEKERYYTGYDLYHAIIKQLNDSYNIINSVVNDGGSIDKEKSSELLDGIKESLRVIEMYNETLESISEDIEFDDYKVEE